MTIWKKSTSMVCVRTTPSAGSPRGSTRAGCGGWIDSRSSPDAAGAISASSPSCGRRWSNGLPDRRERGSASSGSTSPTRADRSSSCSATTDIAGAATKEDDGGAMTKTRILATWTLLAALAAACSSTSGRLSRMYANLKEDIAEHGGKTRFDPALEERHAGRAATVREMVEAGD